MTTYLQLHHHRTNLLVHVLTVPLFILGTLAIPIAFVVGPWWLALAGLGAMVAAIGAQGATHRLEARAPEPFRGPLDVIFCRGPHASRSFQNPPRVVLLDLKLPKVQGLEVLKAIKEDPRTRAIPVVIMTSSREERDLVESYKLGVNAYVQKPVDFEQFRAMVKELGLFWVVMNQAPPPRAFEANA